VTLRNPVVWHVAALLVVSSAYESLFIHHGIAWLFDEGWPLYAAMQLHDGGVLYGDILFPFPPGHLLMAWIAYGLDPPGIILARVFYAAFNVALVVALYFLGRRLTTPAFAFLGALMLAVAASRSHLAHLLFGYRYLVFSVVVLILLDVRLRLGDEDPRRAGRVLFTAGLLAGVALYFRLTPAFAASCGVAVALFTATRDWRTGLRDGVAYGLGLAVIALPLLGWFAFSVGLDVLWREVVTRIVALQSAQSLPSPAFSFWPPSADRGDVYRWFVSVQYRLYILLYAGYAVGLLAAWLRALRGGRRFAHSLLLAVVVWGGIYLLRTLGRSDDHHLNSALPPACLLLAHGVGVLTRLFTPLVAGLFTREGSARLAAPPRLRPAITVAVCTLMAAGWVYLGRADLFLLPEVRGVVPIQVTAGQVRVLKRPVARRVDGVVRAVQLLTGPDDVILDMTGAPLFYPLTGRRGPGPIDVIIPGIFLSAQEEESFVERLRDAPPALVIWSEMDFDRREDRGLANTAPQLVAWVRSAYQEEVAIDRYRILRLREDRR
jgi:hypothetical protein